MDPEIEFWYEKDIMKKYLGNVVDDYEFKKMFTNSKNVEIVVYLKDLIKSRAQKLGSFDLTYLQKCVILETKYSEMFDYLQDYLKRIDNINKLDQYGRTALHYACCITSFHQNIRLIKLLLDHNINIDTQCKSSGNTALFYELDGNAIELLLDAGADPYLKNNRRKMVIEVNTEVCKILKTRKLKLLLTEFPKKINDCVVCLDSTDCVSCKYNHGYCFECINHLKIIICQLCKTEILNQ